MYRIIIQKRLVDYSWQTMAKIPCREDVINEIENVLGEINWDKHWGRPPQKQAVEDVR